MSEWTKQRLEKLISDCVEESLSLEYKAAESLNLSDGGIVDEITKDVSAFGNSSGGALIYGIAEFRDKTKRHLPERLDPIGRGAISKERLEQIIQTIQPRIEGVVIHPVTISDQDNTVCYIVEIPQSQTAHQARDHKYYKRHNFNAIPMEDYEVRDVMNRRTHPKIRASIYINKAAKRPEPEGMILVKLENVGQVLARHAMVELEVPVDLNGLVAVDEPVYMERSVEGDFQKFRLTPTLDELPIFPGSSLILRRKIKTHVRMGRMDGQPYKSTEHVKINVFADEMPPIRAKLEYAPVLLGWTLLNSCD
jgi:hypothetical protein